MNKKDQSHILEGSLWDAIILFALPIAFSSLMQQLFNAADQAVVGRFAGGAALAAVGANTPVVSLFVNVFSSCSIGANALIARRIGEGNHQTINKIVHTAILFSLLAGIGLLILGQGIAGPLLILLGTPKEILPLGVVYLRIYSLAFPFALVFNFGAAILRSTGDTRRPMIALVVAGFINVILNLILVIGFHMSVAGVAIATVVSNVVSCMMVVYYLYKESGELQLRLSRLGIHGESLIQILQIGGPASIQTAVFCVANVCIQSGINSLGADVVAGSAIVNNFESLGFLVVNSFCQAATTFCGQNFGAGQKDRCKKVIRLSLAEAVICAAIYDYVVVFGRNIIISCFSTEPGVMQAATTKIMVVMTLHFLIALYEITSASLRSMGKSMIPALLTIVGSVAFRVFWLLCIFPMFRRFDLLVAVYPASWVLTSTLVCGYYFLVRRELLGESIKSQHFL